MVRATVAIGRRVVDIKGEINRPGGKDTLADRSLISLTRIASASALGRDRFFEKVGILMIDKIILHVGERLVVRLEGVVLGSTGRAYPAKRVAPRYWSRWIGRQRRRDQCGCLLPQRTPDGRDGRIHV